MPTGGSDVYCPAGRFTKVIDTAFVDVHYHVTVNPASAVKWRRYSTFPPHYWEGSFVGSANFYFPADPYIRLEFNPSVNVHVTITPLGPGPGIAKEANAQIGIYMPQNGNGEVIPQSESYTITR